MVHYPIYTLDEASGQYFAELPPIYVGRRTYSNTGHDCPWNLKPNYSWDDDNDGLSNNIEAIYGTNPDSRDTDRDGLTDNLEVRGVIGRFTDPPGPPQSVIVRSWEPQIDMAYYGASPFRRDVFVEFDYHQAYDPDEGGVVSFAPTPAFRTKLSEFLGGLDIQNPDGSSGIEAHSFVDKAYDLTDVDMKSMYQDGTFEGDAVLIFRRRESFVHAWLTSSKQSNVGGVCGSTETGGPRFTWASAAPRDTTDDPLDDRNHYLLFACFIHELGHVLGLRHGGNECGNYKPNYVSVMNYAYQNDALRPQGTSTLRTNSLLYSSGDWDPLPMQPLNEWDPFPSVDPVTQVLALAYYDRPANYFLTSWNQTLGVVHVDWTRDGSFSSVPIPFDSPDWVDPREGTGAPIGNSTPVTFYDHDDINHIATRIYDDAEPGVIGCNGGLMDECRLAEPAPVITAVEPFGMNAAVARALKTLTGKEPQRARALLRDAGIDSEDQSFLRRLLILADYGGKTAPLVRALFPEAASEEFPDGEMERFAAEALEDMYFVATGQSIDVEFVDCPDSLDTAQKLARITSLGQRSATSASTMPGQKNAKQVLWNLGTHVRLCRQPLATPAY